MRKIINQRPIKVGIVGCGQISQIMHLPYLDSISGFEIYALCDISKELVKKLGEKYRVPSDRLFTQYRLMYQLEELDAVFICSKDHYEPTLEAARAKKHIFVEKPFGFSISQAEHMAIEAEKYGVTLMVGYMKRYDSSFAFALEQIKQMQNISLVRMHNFGGSFAHTKDVFDIIGATDIDPAILQKGRDTQNKSMLAGLGADYEDYVGAYSLLLGVATHDSVLLRHAFGNDFEVIASHLHNKTFITALIRFGDVECVFESGLVMKRMIWDEAIDVYSDNCNLKLTFPWPYLKNSPSIVQLDQNLLDSKLPVVSKVSSSFSESYHNELLHFLECITTGKDPITSGRDAVYDMILMTEIIRKAKRQK